MSRIGKKPVALPEKVTFSIDKGMIQVKGPKGDLSMPLHNSVKLEQKDQDVIVEANGTDRFSNAMHGTVRALLANMVKGVTTGFSKNLELHGVGYRASVKGDALDLSVGKSHPVLHPIPAGLKVVVTENTKISVEGIDKHTVGQFAADVRRYCPPEPYKGKGIRYAGEKIRRKAGKSAQK